MLKRTLNFSKNWIIIWNEKFKEYKNLLQKGVTRKYLHEYLVKNNSPKSPGVVLICLGYFWFILPHSCLFKVAAVGHGLFHILYKK